MKNFLIGIFIAIFFMASCHQTTQKKQEPASAPVQEKRVDPTVQKLSEMQYRSLVFDYESHPDQWVFIGNKPCVVDFYAEWCRPCKMIAPFFDTLAREYAGKVNFYKINVDESQNLAQFFNVRSIPTVMFCNTEAARYVNGAYPMEYYRSLVDSLIGLEKKTLVP